MSKHGFDEMPCGTIVVSSTASGDRVAWAYRDRRGLLHVDIALDFDGAEIAASLYGYKRNAPAPPAAGQAA